MIALALSLALQQAETPPCLKDGDVVTGEVRMVETRRPTSKQPLTFPFLVMERPRCVDTPALVAFGRWVQLVLDRNQIKALVPGAEVGIKARYLAPNGPLQIGDIIAANVEIVPAETK